MNIAMIQVKATQQPGPGKNTAIAGWCPVIRLLLWLIWIYCVIELFKWVSDNWDAVIAAPGAFLVFFVLACAATFVANYWVFKGRMDTRKERIDFQEAQIKDLVRRLDECLGKEKQKEDDLRYYYEDKYGGK